MMILIGEKNKTLFKSKSIRSIGAGTRSCTVMDDASMKNEWKRRNGYKDPEPPDCSSSFKNGRVLKNTINFHGVKPPLFRLQ